MSNNIGSASITLSVDSSGIESGMRTADAAVARTGRNLSALAQTGATAMDSVSGGAAASATRLDSATRSIINNIQRTTAAVDAGERGSRQFFESLANQRGIDINVLRPYLDQLEQVRTRQAAATDAARASGNAFQGHAMSANAMSAALRNVPAQFTDIVTSLQGGQRPLSVFLQQGGQLRDMFGSAGGAARALGGYVVSLINPFTLAAAAAAALAIAYNEGSKEADAYRKSLILTGNAAGTSTQQLAGMASAIAKNGGTKAEAADALAKLAGTGAVSVENLEKFGGVAVRAQKAIGQSVEDTVSAFADLAKSPLQATEKLNEKYRYLTLATYEQIKALEIQGKNDEAAKVAQNAYADAIASRSKDITDNLGWLEKGWTAVGGAAKGAWDYMLNVGREDSFDEKLKKAQEALKKAQEARYTFAGGGADGKRDLDNAQAKVDALLQQKDSSERMAAIDAERIRLQEAGVTWDKEGEKFLTRREQLENAITASRNRGLAAGMSDADIAKRELAIRKEYSDIFNAQIDAQIEGIKRRAAVEDIVSARSMAALTANKDAGFATSIQAQFEYAEAAAQFDIAQFNRRKSQLQQELDLTKGKANSDKEQAALRGKMAEIDEQIVSRRMAKENELTVLDVKNTREIAANLAGLADARMADLESLKQQVIAQQDSNLLIGKSKLEIADFTQSLALEKAARLESQAAILANDEQRKAEVETMLESAKKIRTMAALQRDGLIKQEQFDLTKKAFESIDSTAHDVFVNIFNGGKNAFDRLRDTLKSGLLDMLYQMTVKKWIFSIGASMTGYSGLSQAAGLTGGSGSAASGIGSTFSAVTAATSLYKAISGGFASMGSAVTEGVQSAINLFGPGSGYYSTAGSGMAASAPATLAGTAASNLAGIGIGHTVGNVIAGDYSIGGHGQAVTNTAAVIGAVLGGPIGGAIGGAVGGLLNRMFGMGATTVTARSISGTLSASGATGNSSVSTHQDGGWFRSDKNNTTVTALTSDVINTLSQGFDSIKSVTAGFAKDLGASTASLDGLSKTFNIALTDDATKNQEAITSYFNNLGDELAVLLVPTIAQFSKTGESVSTTLQRLAGDFTATTQAATLIGKDAATAFGSVGIASAAAREQLIKFAGGTDALTSQATIFAQNFLTDAERLAPVAKALDAAMASLGLSGVTTREQFKAVVQGLDLTTEAGNKELASLLALADAFAQVHPATMDATENISALKEQRSLEIQLMQEQGRAEEALAATRSDALKSLLSDQARVIQAQIYAAQDAKAAQEKAYSSLVGTAESALSGLTRSVDAQRKNITASFDAQIAASKAATVAAVSDAKVQLDAAQESLNAIKSTYSTLTGALASQQIQSAAFDEARRKQAQAFLASVAATKNLTNGKGISDALSIVAKPSQQFFGTFEDYARDAARTGNLIAGLQVEAGKQVDTGQAAVDAINTTIATLEKYGDDQVALLEQQKEAEQAQLDAMLDSSTKQLNALKGINDSILSLSSAKSVFNNAAGALAGNATAAANSNSVGIEYLYQSILGRASDASGLAFYQGVAANGTTMAEIAASMRNSDEYKKLHPFAVGTNFVPRDMPAYIHEGEAIIPAADNRELMKRLSDPSGNSEVLAQEVRSLQATVTVLQKAISGMNESAKISSDALDAIARGRPINTKVVST